MTKADLIRRNVCLTQEINSLKREIRQVRKCPWCRLKAWLATLKERAAGNA